ncbi:MAG: hypothetical protein U0556_04910 [Dehalococcoidia bacterium]
MTTGPGSISHSEPAAHHRPASKPLLHWIAPLGMVALLAAALWPLTGVSFPATHDGLNHLQRQVAFDSLVRQGVLLPRWYPDFASGYGYPLGNFYPPLALWLAQIPLLLGSGPSLALRLAYGAALVLAGSGAFAFCRRINGPAGGLLGSAAYLFAPYVLANVYDRGALPEALALGLLPWALWAADRWRGVRAGIVPFASLQASIVLTHPLVAALAWPSTAIWWAANRRGSLVRLPLPFLLAAGLSAIFWVPAALEAGTVALDNFATLGSAASAATPIGELVDRTPLYDYSALPYRLGLVQVVAALAGLAVAWGSSAHRRPALIAGLLFGGFSLGATTLATGLWSLPAIQSVQFPWRLLGPASLFGAVLVSFLARLPAGSLVAVAGAALLAIAGTASLTPTDRRVEDRYLTLGAAARREWTEGTVGTTTAAEYLPATARAGYATGQLPADITLGGASFDQVELVWWTPLGWRLTTAASEQVRLRAHQFAFPGWTAWVDDAPVTIAPDGPLGLASITVPAGEHSVELRFATTPPRVAGAIVSALSLVLLGWLVAPTAAAAALAVVVAIGLLGTLLPIRQAPTLGPADLGSIRLLGGSASAGPDGVVSARLQWIGVRQGGEQLATRLRGPDGALLAESTTFPVWNTATRWSANELIGERRDLLPRPGPAVEAAVEVEASGQTVTVGTIWLPERPPRQAGPLTTPSGAVFGDQIRLDGWRVDDSVADLTITPGGILDLTLYWSALRSPEEDWTVFVHLIGPDGTRYGQSDGQPVAGLAPTTLWLPGDVVPDRRRIAVAPNAPPGAYRIEVGLYRLQTGQRLATDHGTSAALGPFKAPMPLTALPAVDPVGERFGPFELLGARAENGRLTLVWKAVDRPVANYQVFVHLLDTSGALIAQADGPPQGSGYPTSLWSVGEVVVDQRPLPAVNAARIKVGLYDPTSGARLSGPAGDSVILPSR